MAVGMGSGSLPESQAARAKTIRLSNLGGHIAGNLLGSVGCDDDIRLLRTPDSAI